MKLYLRGVFGRRMRGQRTGPVQRARPPAGIALHRIAGQQLDGGAHDITHRAFELQLALDIVFGQRANLASFQAGDAGPSGKRQPDRRVCCAKLLALRQLQRNVRGQLRHVSERVGNERADHAQRLS